MARPLSLDTPGSAIVYRWSLSQTNNNHNSLCSPTRFPAQCCLTLAASAQDQGGLTCRCHISLNLYKRREAWLTILSGPGWGPVPSVLWARGQRRFTYWGACALVSLVRSVLRGVSSSCRNASIPWSISGIVLAGVD
jgi:hypothetical protein